MTSTPPFSECASEPKRVVYCCAICRLLSAQSASGDRGAPRVPRGTPNVGGLEGRAGFPGAPRTLGGMGGHVGAPHVPRHHAARERFDVGADLAGAREPDAVAVPGAVSGRARR